MYFSIINPAIGPAQVAPKPAFSTTTATAILGSSLGAKQTTKEWFLPCGFCAVPVLAQYSTPGTLINAAVPIIVTSCMPSFTMSKYCLDILVTAFLILNFSSNALSSSSSFSMLSTKWGV